MKVTMINAEWLPIPPVLGGAVEETIFETALAIRDPELTAISPWHDLIHTLPTCPKEIFHHVHISKQEEKIKELLQDQFPPKMQNPKSARYFYYLNGMTDLLLKINPDIIQIHNRAEFIPYLLKEFPQKRLIVYMHNQPRFAGPALSETIEAIEHLICVSHYLAECYHKAYPRCTEKTTVIHNSVDTNAWHPNLKNAEETENIRRTYNLIPNHTLLFVGRIIHEKGIEQLIEAMTIVKRLIPKVKLIIAGSPFYNVVTTNAFSNRLKKKASSLDDTIIFADYVDHEKTPYLYAAADITVFPSLWDEPFGKVITESMASGTPVIGSKRGAIPELIEHNQTGILVDDPQNVNDLASHIVELLQNKEKRTAIGQAARQKAENSFSKSIRLKRLQTFYKTIEA